MLMCPEVTFGRCRGLILSVGLDLQHPGGDQRVCVCVKSYLIIINVQSVSPCSSFSSSTTESLSPNFSCTSDAHGFTWLRRLSRVASCTGWQRVGNTWSLTMQSFPNSWWCSNFKMSFTEKGVVLVEPGCIPDVARWSEEILCWRRCPSSVERRVRTRRLKSFKGPAQEKGWRWRCHLYTVQWPTPSVRALHQSLLNLHRKTNKQTHLQPANN